MEKEDRPWGSYQILLDEKDCKVKKISVSPMQNLSYQYHHKRDEDWIVIKGFGEVRLDSDKIKVGPGSKVHIPAMAKHSIRSTGEAPLVFIEVQTGEYFGEDDIVRLEDSYGRVSEKGLK